MELYEAIRRRYSVRDYRDEDVEADTLQRILDAGRLAPSARNRQERKFVVVRDPQRRKALAEAADQAWIARAPVILAVVGTTPEAVMHCGVPTDPVDCAIAIDHMTLAAVAEGLGTCWLGHFDQDACRRILEVPPGATIIEMLTIGPPRGEPGPKRRKALEEIVCQETFA